MTSSVSNFMKRPLADRSFSFQSVLHLVDVLGGICGIIALAAIVFKGGQLVQQLRELDSRMVVIESVGSSAAKSHIMLDELRDETMSTRISNVESGIKSINDLRVDLRELSVKLEEVKTRLDTHSKTL